MDAKLLQQIPGSAELIALCGEWPSFHDCEIIDLYLSRSTPSWIRIKLVGWADAVVTFHLEEISDLHLEDFSRQNVIYSLRIEQKGEGLRLNLDPCYGIAGWIDSPAIRITFEPSTEANGAS